MDAISGRHSVRKCESKAIEAGRLLRVLEAARLAPSAARCSFVNGGTVTRDVAPGQE
jgi:nitroreductase